MLKNYDNFFLPADDLERAKEFYQHTLGLTVKFDFSERRMVAFQVGSDEPAIIIRTGDQVKPAIWFEVDNVQQAYQQLAGKGVSFLSAPYAIPTGMAVEFLDPSGNKLGLTDYSKKQP